MNEQPPLSSTSNPGPLVSWFVLHIHSGRCYSLFRLQRFRVSGCNFFKGNERKLLTRFLCPLKAVVIISIVVQCFVRTVRLYYLQFLKFFSSLLLLLATGESLFLAIRLSSSQFCCWMPLAFWIRIWWNGIASAIYECTCCYHVYWLGDDLYLSGQWKVGKIVGHYKKPRRRMKKNMFLWVVQGVCVISSRG